MTVRGTLSLSVDGTAVASLTDASLDVSVESLQAANPDGYGWAYSVDGLKRWTASATLLQALDGAAQDDSQQAVDLAALAGQVVAVLLTTPTGTTYGGSARVETWAMRSGLDRVVRGTYALVGVGTLTRTEPA